MSDQQTVQQFIQLRSQGISLAAEQLRRRIDRDSGTTLFTAGVELCRDDDTRPAVQDWRA